MPKHNGVSLMVYLKCAATLSALAYPLFAVVSNLQHMTAFQPCNENACYLFKLFADEDIPSTFGDYVRVQNGVHAHPIVLSSDLSEAVLVRPDYPLARQYPVLLPWLVGGWLYQIPDGTPQSINGSSTARLAYILCLYGFCKDSDHWIPHIATGSAFVHDHVSSYLAPMELVDAFNFAQSRDIIATDNCSSAPAVVDNCSSAREVLDATNMVLNDIGVVTRLAWKLNKGSSTLYQLPFMGFHPSGVEMLPSAFMSDNGQQASWDHCASHHAKDNIVNTLSHSSACVAYLACIGLWTLCSIVHDWMVLAMKSNISTVQMGFVALLFEACAIGSGFQAAMGAAEVFISRDASSAQVCFFELDPVAALVVSVTPCVLLGAYMQKKPHVHMAIFSGDYLYHRRERVPHRWLSKHKAWANFSGLVPNPPTTSKQTGDPLPLPSGEELTRCLFLSLALAVVEIVGLLLPTCLAVTGLFPKAMRFLVVRVNHLPAVLSVLLFLPAAVSVLRTGVHAKQGFKLLRKEAGQRDGRLVPQLSMPVSVIVAGIGQVLLLLPPLEVSGSGSEIPELLPYMTLWATGSFFITLSTLSQLVMQHPYTMLIQIFICAQTPSWKIPKGSPLPNRTHPRLVASWADENKELCSMFGLESLAEQAEKEDQAVKSPPPKDWIRDWAERLDLVATESAETPLLQPS